MGPPCILGAHPGQRLLAKRFSYFYERNLV
jgi:hypothetical protein